MDRGKHLGTPDRLGYQNPSCHILAIHQNFGQNGKKTKRGQNKRNKLNQKINKSHKTEIMQATKTIQITNVLYGNITECSSSTAHHM